MIVFGWLLAAFALVALIWLSNITYRYEQKRLAVMTEDERREERFEMSIW